jgi:hypothetical protein
MSAVLVSFLSVLVLGDAPFGATGTIQGVVVNGSQRGEPIADVDVQLRAGMHGVFESVAATKTDFYGKFVFENLPLESRIIYLPGANLAGVHYPGQRVRLEPNSRMVYVKIVAYDANLNVSPLEAKRHDIRIDFATNVLEVTESILISNPSRTTYVGQPRNDEPPITLRLSIPPHFDRVTFENEFYGRRFRIVDRGVDTDIPWPPGDTELQFTYRIPSEASSGLFQRALDIPSSDVRIHVRPKEAQSVSCNLPKSTNNGDELLFAAVDKKLPAGFTIELQIGDAPVPWNRFARWGSLFMLAALVLATLLINRRRWRFGQQRRAEDPRQFSANRPAA